MVSINVYEVVVTEEVEVGERVIGFFEVVEAIVGVKDGRRVGAVVGEFAVGERVVGLKVVGDLVRVLEGEAVGSFEGKTIGLEDGEGVLMASLRCEGILVCKEETLTAAVSDLLGTVKVIFLTALEAFALNCE